MADGGHSRLLRVKAGTCSAPSDPTVKTQHFLHLVRAGVPPHHQLRGQAHSVLTCPLRGRSHPSAEKECEGSSGGHFPKAQRSAAAMATITQHLKADTAHGCLTLNASYLLPHHSPRFLPQHCPNTFSLLHPLTVPWPKTVSMRCLMTVPAALSCVTHSTNN